MKAISAQLDLADCLKCARLFKMCLKKIKYVPLIPRHFDA
jgi:hypothetical protein